MHKTNAHLHCVQAERNINSFIKFLVRKGLATREKCNMIILLENLNYFLYTNAKYISDCHGTSLPIVEDLTLKRLNYFKVFNHTMDMIKPPFVIKSIAVSKKLRKRTKLKYVLKIAHKDDDKLLRNGYKQLHYYSNQFTESKFSVRVYKAIILSFLDQETSQLFRLKKMIFKKFFRI